MLYAPPGGPRGWDAHRTARLAGYAAATTPLVHSWLGLLATARLTRSPAVRVLADQLCYTPPATALFFYSQALLSGSSQTAALMSAVASTPPTLRTSLLLWPAVQLFAFTFIPLHLQILLFNVVGLAWAMHLSSAAHMHHPQADAVEEAAAAATLGTHA